MTVMKHWALSASLLLATPDMFVSGRIVRGNAAKYSEIHEDEWDAVSNKTTETLLYYAGEDFQGTPKAKSHIGGSLRARKSSVIEDKKVQLRTGDDIISEETNTFDIIDYILPEENEAGSGKVQNTGHRMLASTQIKIKNNCDESVNVLLLTKNSAGGYNGRWSQVDPGSTSQSAVGTTHDPDFFFYAESNSHEWVGNSKWCLNGGSRCLKNVKLNGNPSRFTYTISCGSNVAPPQTGGNGGNNGGNGANSGGGQSMTARDKLWLQEHNTRRQKWHESDYVPLKWNNGIKQSAQAYANKLISRGGCRISHGYMGDNYGGENLASNYGGGQKRPPSNILKRWVEDEANLSFSQKLHFTQVIWKATTYVGCAEASKPYNGGECHIQVCRYIRPGNCNADAGNYKKKMLDRYSPCTPFEPN